MQTTESSASSLEQAQQYESIGLYPTALTSYLAVLQQEPQNRNALAGCVRLQAMLDMEPEFSVHLADYVIDQPFDYEAISILIEADPGLLCQRKAQIVTARRTRSAPDQQAPTWRSMAQSRDRAIHAQLTEDANLVSLVEAEQRQWLDAAYRRAFLLNLVRVSPRQLSGLWELHCLAASRLGIDPPELFISPDEDINAAAYGGSDCLIVVNKGLLKGKFTDEEIVFILGHEMGHIIHRHVLLTAVAEKIANDRFQIGSTAEEWADGLSARNGWLSRVGAWVARGVASYQQAQIEVLIDRVKRWQQYSEYSADRAGLLACGSLDAAVYTLKKLGGYESHLSDIDARFGAGLDMDEFLTQADQVYNRFRHVTPEEEMTTTHPFIPYRIRAIQAWTLSGEYHYLLGQTG